jgi:hypothetical protein
MPGACTVNLSITDGCKSTSAAGSMPSPIAHAASLEAPHSSDLARSARGGADAATTALANTAAAAGVPAGFVRSYACGKRRCRCHDDPPVLHGPYAEWTRKIEGKTVTRRLTPEQLAAWQPLFDNARKMRDLLARIQDLTLQAVDTDDT